MDSQSDGLYGDDLGYLQDHLVTDAIPHKKVESSPFLSLSDFELVDQPFCKFVIMICSYFTLMANIHLNYVLIIS